MSGTVSPTRAAILGQLTWGPQTAYELTLAMSQHVRFVWPRAHSHVYREVKALARDGLARVERGATGRRPRAVYSLSDAGRGALRDWLASEPGGVALEHEPLLRVMFASAGTREDLLTALGHARALAEELVALGRSHGQRYLALTHERQSEVHLRVFTFDYLIRWAAFSADWAIGVEREVRGWDDLAAAERRSARALRRIDQVLHEVDGPAEEPGNAEVASVVRAYRDCFNRADAEALAQLYCADIVFVDLHGSTFVGRDAVRERQAVGFRGPLADVAVELDVEDVTELGDGHVLARVRQSIRHRDDDRGATAAVPAASIVTMIIERWGRKTWLIRHFQNTPVLG